MRRSGSRGPTVVRREPTVAELREQYRAEQRRAGLFGLDPQGFNLRVEAEERWRPGSPHEWVARARNVLARISGGRCCPRAESVPCVCEVAYFCPDHGHRHTGSHD